LLQKFTMDKIISEYDFNDKKTARLLIRNFNINKLSLSSDDKKQILILFDEKLAKGKYCSALNFLVLGLLYSRERTIDFIRRKGLFRYSKYLERKCIIQNICAEVITLSADLKLSTEVIDYLHSIIKLAPIYTIQQTLRLEIIKEIKLFKDRNKKNNKSFIKTLLVYLDYLFLINYQAHEKGDPNNISFYSKETIAEAISFIFYLNNRLPGGQESEVPLLDEDYILSNKINNILLNACYFKKLQEIEIYVDHFSYKCFSINKHLKIIPPFPEIEKSIRLGYVRSQLQDFSDLSSKDAIDDKTVSILGICNDLMNQSKINIVNFVESGPYPRYRIELPQSLNNRLNVDFFSQDKIFKEEQDYIFYSLKEYFINLSEARNAKLRDNLTLFDFVKLKRFFVFLYILFFQSILKLGKVDPKVILRSLVPGYSSKEVFHKFLNKITSTENIESFVDLLTWDPDQGTILDLQYQPLVKKGNQYLVPVCLFANCNTLRNVYSLGHKLHIPEIFDNGEYDLIADFLSITFQKIGFATFKSIQHDYKDGGDIDFLAINNEMIFIAECKKSLLPTDIFELRTLYDNLGKGSKQLDLIIEALGDSETRKKISAKIGYEISGREKITASIITNNRLFVGLRLFKYPVRHILEAINILETGIIKYINDEYSVWKDKSFSLDDLSYYFSDPDFHQYFYNAMIKRDLVFKFSSINIVQVTYIYKPDLADRYFKKLGYRKIGPKST